MKKFLSILCVLMLITVSCSEKHKDSSPIATEQIYLKETDITLSEDF